MSCKVHFKDESSSLSHYGVKGQKWGVRRYQEENGELTAQGKAKYEKEKVGEPELNKNVTEQKRRNKVAIAAGVAAATAILATAVTIGVINKNKKNAKRVKTGKKTAEKVLKKGWSVVNNSDVDWSNVASGVTSLALRRR